MRNGSSLTLETVDPNTESKVTEGVDCVTVFVTLHA